METQNILQAKPISGFFIECLSYNVPNSYFAENTWDKTIQNVLLHLWSTTKPENDCSEWSEVSEWKYLFKGSPAEKKTQAHAFIDAAWNYVGVR